MVVMATFSHGLRSCGFRIFDNTSSEWEVLAMKEISQLIKIWVQWIASRSPAQKLLLSGSRGFTVKDVVIVVVVIGAAIVIFLWARSCGGAGPTLTGQFTLQPSFVETSEEIHFRLTLNGGPVGGKSVTFTVPRGDVVMLEDPPSGRTGSPSGGVAGGPPALTVTTDSTGTAKVTLVAIGRGTITVTATVGLDDGTEYTEESEFIEVERRP